MSRKPLFERGRLTDWLLEELGGALPAEVLLGDGVAPNDGGWQGGQPGQGKFIGYSVLGTGAAAPGGTATLAETDSSEWLLRYTLRSAGGVRHQADFCADKARQAWHRLVDAGEPVIPLGNDADPSNWKVYSPLVVSMGAVSRTDQTQPPFWEVLDEVTVKISRSRRP
jgi:hypothetical protein